MTLFPKVRDQLLEAAFAPESAPRRVRRGRWFEQALVGSAITLTIAIATVFVVGVGKAPRRSVPRASSPARTGPSSVSRDGQATAVAHAVTAYLFPRSGADWATGIPFLVRETRQVAKVATACLAAEGLPAAPGPFVPPFQYGTAQLPNLPVIERTLKIGVTEAVRSPADPTAGMSKGQAAAYDAALKRCEAKPESSLAFLGNARTVALTQAWDRMTSAVIASEPVRRLNHAATRCAATTAFRASSVVGEIQAIEAPITPLNLKGRYRAARSIEKAGSRVLIRCFGAEITRTAQVLSGDRTALFLAHGRLIDEIETDANRAANRLR